MTSPPSDAEAKIPLSPTSEIKRRRKRRGNEKTETKRTTTKGRWKNRN